MDNFGFWVYLIVAIIYLFVRAKKKVAPKEVNGPQSPNADRPFSTPTTSNKPQSFEDLLREIMEAKSTAEKKTREVTRPQLVTQKREEQTRREAESQEWMGEEIDDLEDVDFGEKQRKKFNLEYEAAKNLAFNRPSLEETMRLQDTDMQYGKFKEFEIEQRRNLLQLYLNDFKDPEGLKKAVVMSEILKRKF